MAMHQIDCPGCQTAVPMGRWCNRCGEPLGGPSASETRARMGGVVGVPRAAVALFTFVLAIALLPLAGGRAIAPWESNDVLVPDAQALRDLRSVPDTSSVRERTVVRATVVCSGARPIRVPVRDIGAADVGDVVHLGIGTCVVFRRPASGDPGGGAFVVR